jgi:hypothetical protein
MSIHIFFLVVVVFVGLLNSFRFRFVQKSIHSFTRRVFRIGLETKKKISVCCIITVSEFDSFGLIRRCKSSLRSSIKSAFPFTIKTKEEF